MAIEHRHPHLSLNPKGKTSRSVSIIVLSHLLFLHLWIQPQIKNNKILPVLNTHRPFLAFIPTTKCSRNYLQLSGRSVTSFWHGNAQEKERWHLPRYLCTKTSPAYLRATVPCRDKERLPCPHHCVIQLMARGTRAVIVLASATAEICLVGTDQWQSRRAWIPSSPHSGKTWKSIQNSQLMKNNHLKWSTFGSISVPKYTK